MLKDEDRQDEEKKEQLGTWAMVFPGNIVAYIGNKETNDGGRPTVLCERQSDRRHWRGKGNRVDDCNRICAERCQSVYCFPNSRGTRNP